MNRMEKRTFCLSCVGYSRTCTEFIFLDHSPQNSKIEKLQGRVIKVHRKLFMKTELKDLHFLLQIREITSKESTER